MDEENEFIVNELRKLLPNELFSGSKDWTQSGLVGKVEWLLAMYQSKKEECEHAYDMLEKLGD